MIDIQRIRAETPACNSVLHFNNAGAALMPEPVYSAVQAHFQQEIEIGGYLAESRAEDVLARFYTEFEALLGAQTGEIAFAENATRAWDMAFYGMPLRRGDRIITHEAEYESNFLALLQQAWRRGLKIDVVPSDADGQIDLQKLEDAITPETRLIALTHVPTHSGLVNPAEAVGEIAERRGLIYLLDACQSIGQIELDVTQLRCHALSGTGRKFLRGPRGTGFLYVRNDLVDRMDPPFIDLQSATLSVPGPFKLQTGARRFETWETNIAGRIGLMRAVEYARGVGLAAIEARVTGLAAQLRLGLAGLPGVTVRDEGQKKCGIVTFSKEGVVPGDMVNAFAERGINVSATANPFALLDPEKKSRATVVRASVHYYNTEEEIAQFIEAVDGFVSSG